MRSKSGGKWQRLESHWLAVVYLCGWFPNQLAVEWELLYTELLTLLVWTQEEAEEEARAGCIFHFTSKELACSRAGALVLRHLPRAFGKLCILIQGVPCFQESHCSLGVERKSGRFILCFGFQSDLSLPSESGKSHVLINSSALSSLPNPWSPAQAQTPGCLYVAVQDS